MDRETALSDQLPSSPTDDRFLLALVQSGDEKALTTLFDRYSRIVYSIALRVLGDPASAEDILQEIFMQLWRNPDSFTASGGSLGGWLAILSRNRSIDALRRTCPSDPIHGVFLAAPSGLCGEAERNSLAERACAILQQLPPAQRKALEMAFFDGLACDEIAEMTGDSVGTVETSMRGALLALREAFQP